MNFLTLDGRVGKNGAEIKTSKGGKQYLKFTLANNSFSGGQNKTTWFDVVCYKPELINGIGQYLKKGSFVNVRGPMEVTHNVDQNNKVWINIIVTADLIEFPQVGGKRDDDGSDASTYTGNTQSSAIQQQISNMSNEQIAAMATQMTTPTDDVSVYSGDSDDLPF